MIDSERVAHSIAEQLRTGISYNPAAGIQARMLADGFWPANVRELYDGNIAYMGAEHPRTGESRLYQWTAARGVWWIPRPTGNTPPPPPPKDTFKAKLGLHASANGGAFAQTDYGEFLDLDPSIIKVMTNHDTSSIVKLRQQHPNVDWIVRVFYSTGGRAISPAKLFDETVADTKRVLSAINSSRVVIELHNEPNLVSEGMFMSQWTVPTGQMDAGWCGGSQFNAWYLTLLAKYRAAIPGARFIFPGLSPGGTIDGVRINHQSFAEDCKQAIFASDGLGVHTYWEGDYMAKATSVVDWYAANFPNSPLWVTEASNNQPYDASKKAAQYATFWQMMQSRRQVKGVTYFVVSGNYPTETWAGKGMAKMVRQAI